MSENKLKQSLENILQQYSLQLGSKIIVEQTGSAIGRPKDQGASLKGLGLGKMHRKREHKVTAEILGQINKINHLINVIKA